MNIDDVLPDPAYRISASQVIHAPASVVWDHLISLQLSSLPWSFVLTALRHLPAVLVRRERPVSGRDTFLDETPIPVLFSDEPRQIISGGLSQPWKLFGGEAPPVLSLDEFRDWIGSGWIKVAMSFDLVEDARTATTTLSTETRIGIVDPSTARAFSPYWWLIKGGSALIRREVISRVKRRAEAVTPAADSPATHR